ADEYGLTFKEIERDGFVINERVENLLAPDGKAAMAKSTGLSIILLSDAFQRLNPDVVLLLGDRFETHGAATTAMLMNIPIAHVHGGEITEGAVDDQIRHAITKMAYLHFTSTEEYRNRVIQMGEAPARVFCCGAPGIDNVIRMNLLGKEDLEKQLQWKLYGTTALVTLHSETNSSEKLNLDITRILEVLSNANIRLLFTYANADDGGLVINRAIESFVEKDRENYRVIKSLGQLNYLSAMRHLDLLIGNTSSGIIEAASFHKAVVNIGIRQQGRLRSQNVIDCDVADMDSAISKALSPSFVSRCRSVTNIYGDGMAAKRIVKTLEMYEFDRLKRFHDL
ncbi:MAG: UDP-N-acetylglucosamine 2-epimerase (hydrolyzing), partial [Cycloclasticus sp.]|nr:UDP-N-acetylglucosamine 2-epimerase (hydrolyzing) [Cycloclasticus sp.]